MGNKFLALRKSETAKAAPDRAALMGKVSQEMADMKTIREADRRWLCLLFGEPYEAKFQSEGTGSAVHVYDGNGDEVLTYTAGVGWHEKESRAETQVHGALKAAYYDVFRAARQEINDGAVEMQGGFDARRKARMKKPSPEQKDVLNPEEAVQYFGFSRRKFFGMLREGKFKKYTALYGRRRLILRREFEKYLEENPEVKEGLLNGGKSKVTA